MKIKDIAKCNPKDTFASSKSINYIDTSSVYDGKLVFVQNLSVNYPSRAKRIVRKEDILISSVRPSLKHNYYVNKTILNGVASTGFILIRVTKPNLVLPRYLYYFLTNDNRVSEFSSIAESSQSTFPAFKKEIIENLYFPSKSLIEQQHIVDILGSIDDKIELNEMIIKKLGEIANSFFMLFVAEKEANASLGDIIIENPTSKIQVNEAKKIQDGEFPFFTSGANILTHNNFTVDFRNIFLNTGGNADVKYYIGKANYSTDTWCITAKEAMTDYLYLLLLNMKNEIETAYFEGSALKHLKKEKLKQVLIYKPNNNEITKFNSTVSILFDKISWRTQENKKLNKLKQLYLKKFFG